MAALNGGHEPMPAQRQPVRHVEGCAAHELPINHARRHIAIELLTLPFASVLENPLHIDPRAIGHVHPELVAASLASHNGRRESTAPLAFIGQAHCVLNVSDCRRLIQGESKCSEDFQEGWRTDTYPIPVPIPETGRDTVDIGDMSQQINIVRCGGMGIHGTKLSTLWAEDTNNFMRVPAVTKNPRVCHGPRS